MKYKITIQKFVEKEVLEDIYLSEGERVPDGPRYVKEKVMKAVAEDIYEQTSEDEIDLRSIIDVFNGTKKTYLSPEDISKAKPL